jgi:hypothetical protein
MTELSTYVVAGTEDERTLALEVMWWRNRFPATAAERAQIDNPGGSK